MPLEFTHFGTFKAQQNPLRFFEPAGKGGLELHASLDRAFSDLTETAGDNQ